jgi:hypothetical protein
MTFTFVSWAMEENKFPADRHLRRAIEKLTSERRLTVEELEGELRRRHRSGIEHGHVLLRALIRELHEPFRNCVELLSANEGGAPPDWFRVLVIDQLADASFAIIGVHANSTHDGPFVRLCREVLSVFKQTTAGTRNAVTAVLKRRKANIGPDLRWIMNLDR